MACRSGDPPAAIPARRSRGVKRCKNEARMKRAVLAPGRSYIGVVWIGETFRKRTCPFDRNFSPPSDLSRGMWFADGGLGGFRVLCGPERERQMDHPRGRHAADHLPRSPDCAQDRAGRRSAVGANSTGVSAPRPFTNERILHPRQHRPVAPSLRPARWASALRWLVAGAVRTRNSQARRLHGFGRDHPNASAVGRSIRALWRGWTIVGCLGLIIGSSEANHLPDRSVLSPALHRFSCRRRRHPRASQSSLTQSCCADW
jgi:hypothetical protein